VLLAGSGLIFIERSCSAISSGSKDGFGAQRRPSVFSKAAVDVLLCPPLHRWKWVASSHGVHGLRLWLHKGRMLVVDGPLRA